MEMGELQWHLVFIEIVHIIIRQQLVANWRCLTQVSFNKNRYGHQHPRAAKQGHEPNSVEGHEAGDGRAPSSACSGIPLPSPFIQTAQTSRYRAPKVAHGHLRERMLLASARGMQDDHDAQVKRGVLAVQVRQERGS